MKIANLMLVAACLTVALGTAFVPTRMSVAQQGLLKVGDYKPVNTNEPAVQVASLPSAKLDERLILGVLEHHDSEGRKGHGVRVAFYKEEGQWRAYPANFNTQEELSRAVKSFPQRSRGRSVSTDGRPAL